MRKFMWIGCCIALLLTACDSFPIRHEGEVAPVSKKTLAATLSDVVRIANNLGFSAADCAQFKKKNGDVSAKALTYGAFSINDNTKEPVCLIKGRNDSEYFFITAYLVLTQDDRRSVKVEMWATPARKERDLLPLASRFWNEVGKISQTTSKVAY